MTEAKKQAQLSKALEPIKPLFGRGRIRIDSPAQQQPNWDKWRHMRDIELWEAETPSLNYAPKELPVYFGAYDRLGDDPFRICPSPFLNRLHVANSYCNMAI
ncbi:MULTISPECIES: hypothetical protein [unclassified Janthinobacterium]|uniref:hypothetical protein n=1 Tax=unclassified Janthinobacterium TaxID=2610881 RepID=UPI0012FC019E|nr:MULTISPECIES: hypothetical protein [unclassified Janthinobacterium]MEC5159833.1 hypothetical protein [Janthinobacterium sp. CG_S6]